MNKNFLLIALAAAGSLEIYGSQSPELQYSDLHLPAAPQRQPQQPFQTNYPELYCWPAPTVSHVDPQELNYYNLPPALQSPMQLPAGSPVYLVPPTSGLQQHPAYNPNQQPQNGGETPTAPVLSDAQQQQLAQQSIQARAAHANHEITHHDDVVKRQPILPVELAAGYCMGLLMSDEILGFLQKLGYKKEVKADTEKLRKKRAWYIPAVLVATYLAYKFGPNKETKKFVECACDQRGFHEITRISILDRLGNAAIGYAIGLLMPHLETQPEASKKNTHKNASARN